MQAIEFTTKTEDGIIKIPKKYLKNLKQKVRVIILIEEEETQKEPLTSKERFKAFQVKTKDLEYTRNEANER